MYKKHLFKKLLIFFLCIFFFLLYTNNCYCKNSCNTDILFNEEYSVKLLKYLKKADKEVYITAYMWCCHADKYASIPCKILDTIIHLVKRGVKVVIIFEKSSRDDTFCNKEAILIFKHTLLKKYKNLQIYTDIPTIRSHEKIFLIDGQYIFLGSHNITQSALKYNNEVSVFIKSKEKYNSIKNYIENIITLSKKIY